jgi:molybdopterin/thiamine biosynthesis adenylyltransferase
MERDIKIDSGILKSCVSDDQYKEILNLHKHFAHEEDDVKVIRKAIKKLDKATFPNIAERIKESFGVVKLRRLLNTYEDAEWKAVEVKQLGKGRPTKLYERIK